MVRGVHPRHASGAGRQVLRVAVLRVSAGVAEVVVAVVVVVGQGLGEGLRGLGEGLRGL